jgi:ketosteroid isomerase-like protein
MNNNVATVNRIYQAFGKGDIPTIIDCLADNVQWEQWADNSAQRAGVPWMQAQKGKQGVINFFNAVGSLKSKIFKCYRL